MMCLSHRHPSFVLLDIHPAGTVGRDVTLGVSRDLRECLVRALQNSLGMGETAREFLFV